MDPNTNALQNAMASAQGASQGPTGPTPPPQPGDKTDPLLSAMKALQQYNKTTMERDPKSPELKLVRQIMQELARLTHMDQTLKTPQGNPMQAPMGSDMGMNMGGGMDGAPQMPDLSTLGRLQ